MTSAAVVFTYPHPYNAIPQSHVSYMFSIGTGSTKSDNSKPKILE
jgi:hypothetical protein